MLPTASRLQRAAVCPASVVLPQVASVSEASERGTSIHAFLAAVGKVGRDEALLLVPEEHRAACDAIDLEALPCSPGEFIAEVAFAFDTESGKARELGRDINRKYEVMPSEIAGTADVVGIGHDAVFVGDFKTGRGPVVAACENWQLKFLALCACRVYQMPRATVALIHIDETGEAKYDMAHLEADDLSNVANDLVLLAERVELMQSQVRAGATIDVVTGDHCRSCPAMPHCPGHMALVRRLAQKPDAVVGEIQAALTPKTAALAWERLKQVEEVVKRVRAALFAFAAQNPIQLRNGVVLGEVESSRRELDGFVARHVLKQLHGPEVADQAVEYAASQASIERALRPVAKATGKALAALKREVLDEIDDQGGVFVKVTRSVREHRAEETESTPVRESESTANAA
jgi:hypothetical protein